MHQDFDFLESTIIHGALCSQVHSYRRPRDSPILLSSASDSSREQKMPIWPSIIPLAINWNPKVVLPAPDAPTNAVVVPFRKPP